MSWLIPRSELTPEQLRAIELSHGEHRVIFGAPGSGKTQILIHRADELRRIMRSANDRFLILVYTKVLKTYISSALNLLGLPEQSVMTYDDWCKKFYQQHISAKAPWNKEARSPDFDAIRAAVSQKIATGTVPLPLYDFVLVDEAQDLEPSCFINIRKIAKHVTVCLDNKQQIYDRGSSESDIITVLGLKRRNLTLLDAYRCSPYIARVASQLIANSEEREQYLKQVRTEQTERQTPLIYQAESFEEEKNRLIEVLRQRLLTDQRIAILFPMRKQVFGFKKGLEEVGIEVETQDNLNFTSGKPKLITYHSAKGLTFDSVLLPRLVTGSFPNSTPEKMQRLLFVAITRATRWVFLSTTTTGELPLLDSLKRLSAERVLTVQTASDALQPVKVTKKEPTQSQDLDFL